MDKHSQQKIFRAAQFFTSAVHLKDCPADSLAEIAMLGRSNVGKSTVINSLCEQKGLAKSSKTPGRTHTINFFTLQPNHYIVDLPGYGYAKVSKEQQAAWEKSLDTYLQKREPLCGAILIMDIRHPMTELDITLLEWLAPQTNLPCRLLLNKADKLPRHAQQTTLRDVQQYLEENELPHVTPQLYSTPSKEGVTELRAWMLQALAHSQERS